MKQLAEHRFLSLHQNQQGAVLFALLIGVFLLTGTGFLAGQFSADKKLATDREKALSLAMAREALISYAVTYTDNYGHNTRGGVGRLPCPASQPHGSPSLSCGRHAVGYLPSVWNRDGKRIDIDYREFFLQQNLWYAVSADFRYNPAYNYLNPVTDGSFLTVNGRDDIIAVIIHPGTQTAGQNRQTEFADINDYLSSENADGDSDYEINTADHDRVVTISRDKLMPLMERRVLGIVKDWLTEYRDKHGHLPFAARLGDPDAECEEGLLAGMIAMNRGDCHSESLGELLSSTVPGGRSVVETWFGRYGWSAFIYYQVERACTSPATGNDCPGKNTDPALTVNGQPVAALLVSVGREITTAHDGVEQDRLSLPNERASYLDSPALVEAALSYDLADLRTDRYSNDQVMVLR